MEAAEASSRSAEREISLSALLFCELFSCAYIAKRKAANNFVLFNELLLLQQGLSLVWAVFMDEKRSLFLISSVQVL